MPGHKIIKDLSTRDTAWGPKKLPSAIVSIHWQPPGKKPEDNFSIQRTKLVNLYCPAWANVSLIQRFQCILIYSGTPLLQTALQVSWLRCHHFRLSFVPAFWGVAWCQGGVSRAISGCPLTQSGRGPKFRARLYPSSAPPPHPSISSYAYLRVWCLRLL